jgi:hypothetical protein
MPWKSVTQLAASRIVPTRATLRSASRASSAATAGTLATVKTTETSRTAVSVGEISVAMWTRRKCRGAPPRRCRTMSSISPSGFDPTNSASVSSSWGGQACSRARRNAATVTVVAPTPSRNHRGDIGCCTA